MSRNIKCKACVNINHNGWWCEKVLDSPDLDMIRDCQYFREKTNADRIRAMNDYELAVFLAKTKALVYRDELHVIAYSTQDMADNLEWLQKPVEEAH